MLNSQQYCFAMFEFSTKIPGLLTISRKLSPFLIIFIFQGCNTSTTNQNAASVESNRTAMEIFSSSLMKVKLPFKDTCFDTVAVQHIKLPDSLSNLKQYGQIIGKVDETPEYIAILFSKTGDIQVPILRTFNHKGDLISSLRLYIGNCCGENEDCSGLSTAIVKDNTTRNTSATMVMEIYLKDSTQTFERDKKKFDKKRNIKILVKEEYYTINDKGEIKRIDNQSRD
jgi:hypothetical protein